MSSIAIVKIAVTIPDFKKMVKTYTNVENIEWGNSFYKVVRRENDKIIEDFYPAQYTLIRVEYK